MKAIIYSCIITAQADLLICLHQPVRVTDTFGSPDFVQPLTYLRQHPRKKKWALIATTEIELLLGRRAEILSPDWSSENQVQPF